MKRFLPDLRPLDVSHWYKQTNLSVIAVTQLTCANNSRLRGPKRGSRDGTGRLARGAYRNSGRSTASTRRNRGCGIDYPRRLARLIFRRRAKAGVRQQLSDHGHFSTARRALSRINFAVAKMIRSPPNRNAAITIRTSALRRFETSPSRKQRSLDDGRSFWRRGGISRLVLLVQTCWFRTREESSDPSTFVISAANWSCW